MQKIIPISNKSIEFQVAASFSERSKAVKQRIRINMKTFFLPLAYSLGFEREKCVLSFFVWYKDIVETHKLLLK